jgi:hypothetical protein
MLWRNINTLAEEFAYGAVHSPAAPRCTGEFASKLLT